MTDEKRDLYRVPEHVVQMAYRACLASITFPLPGGPFIRICARAGAITGARRIIQIKQNQINRFCSQNQREYNYGKRSTTDVLYADQNLRAAQIDLATSRHDIVVAEASLLAAMGRLQARTLQLNTPYYDAHAVIHRAQTREWEPLQTHQYQCWIKPGGEVSLLPARHSPSQAGIH